MKRIVFAVAATAALALPSASWAEAFHNDALVMRSGQPCNACQFIVQYNNTHGQEIRIVQTGSTQTGGSEYYDPVLARVVIGSFTINANNNIICAGGQCYETVWARYPCPAGYMYSQTKSGWAMDNYIDFWGTLTINTSQGCHPAAPLP
jgi:hypothetical protein